MKDIISSSPNSKLSINKTEMPTGDNFWSLSYQLTLQAGLAHWCPVLPITHSRNPTYKIKLKLGCMLQKWGVRTIFKGPSFPQVVHTKKFQKLQWHQEPIFKAPRNVGLRRHSTLVSHHECLAIYAALVNNYVHTAKHNLISLSWFG